MVSDVTDSLRKLQQIHSSAVFSYRFIEMFSSDAKTLKGDAFVALKRHAEAVQSFTEVIFSLIVFSSI
jgi:hypothetical protein